MDRGFVLGRYQLNCRHRDEGRTPVSSLKEITRGETREHKELGFEVTDVEGNNIRGNRHMSRKWHLGTKHSMVDTSAAILCSIHPTSSLLLIPMSASQPRTNSISLLSYPSLTILVSYSQKKGHMLSSNSSICSFLPTHSHTLSATLFKASSIPSTSHVVNSIEKLVLYISTTSNLCYCIFIT